MAKVTFLDGSTMECTGKSIDQIYDQIRAAQESKPPGLFIKCGEKYIRIDQIKIIGREVKPDDDDRDDKPKWPKFKITIQGVDAEVKVKD